MTLDPKYFFQLSVESGLLSNLRHTEGPCVFEVPFYRQPSNNRPGHVSTPAPGDAALPGNSKKDGRLPR